MHCQRPPCPPLEPSPAPTWRAWTGHLVVLTALSGCASWELAPEPAAAAIDVPLAWSAADAAGAGAQALGGDSLAGWWQRFDDPLLADLVARALQANTSVAGAQAALRQAQALRDVAAAALLPTLGASASAERSWTQGSGAGSSSGNRFQLGLDAQWVPDVFGARRNSLDAGDAVAAASAASLGDTQVQVAADVAQSYIVMRLAQARRRITSDSLASQLETLQITDWRQQAGLVTVLEVDQARAAAAQTRALLQALQTGVEQAAHALAVLVGLPPASLLAELAAPAQAEDIITVPGEFVTSIPADTLRQRADVRAAELQVAAALARVGQAQAQRWPSFSIGGSIGLGAISAAALTNGTSALGSLLAGISLPVFDGGAARAQVRAQQAALAQAQALYRAAVLGALKEVEDALVALRDDRLRLASLRTAADAAASAALLARQRYSSGLVDFQTVLETQRNQLATQDGVAGARADIGQDQVRLFTALGGGWRTSAPFADAARVSPR